MAESQPQKAIRLDGRTGEGGGQVVRVAVALAALTGTPIRIDNVRGNRPGQRGAGLKAQHASCIQALAAATDAYVSGSTVGSTSFEFEAKLAPTELVHRDIEIDADSAASIELVLQAILPFLIFAGDERRAPITVAIRGGSNVGFSLSFEYLDQVLLPALERFGIEVDRKLECRGWSHGNPQIGLAKFRTTPPAPGQSIEAPVWPKDTGKVTEVCISILVPSYLQEALQRSLLFEIGLVFPAATIHFALSENSGHSARIYTLLVAHTSTGLRFGRDWLYDKKSKNRNAEQLATEISRRVVDELDTEVRKGGVVDEYLQDQLIVFQALAEGKSSMPDISAAVSSDRERNGGTDEPFGSGSLHTRTARWVASQLLPQVKWIDRGRVCDGAGWVMSARVLSPKPELPSLPA